MHIGESERKDGKNKMRSKAVRGMRCEDVKRAWLREEGVRAQRIDDSEEKTGVAGARSLVLYKHDKKY